MRTTLYRAAEREGGYFGRGSYWTPSRKFADRFASWAEHQQKVIQRIDLLVWSLEIEEPDDAVLDLRPPGDLMMIKSETVPVQSRHVDSRSTDRGVHSYG